MGTLETGKKNRFATDALYIVLRSKSQNQSDGDGGPVLFVHLVQFSGLIVEKQMKRGKTGIAGKFQQW